MAINRINKQVQELLIIPRNAEQTFREYLIQLLDYYKQLLIIERSNLEQYCFKDLPFSELLKSVNYSINKLLIIYDAYMQGNIGKAIRVAKQYFFNIESVFTEALEPNEKLYRARVVEQFSDKLNSFEMFHLPFEKRSFISNNRFSISGYPCLYLGQSILACWEEMHKPNLDIMYVSSCSILNNQRKNMIDLRWKNYSDNYWNIDDTDFDSPVRFKVWTFIHRMPLKIACSIPVFNQNSPFKEEYVIPQVLLLSCFGDKKVDGIAYTSTRRDDQISNELSLHHNYVFPVQKIKDRGFCEKLTADFQITHGISFMEADIKNVFHAKGTPNVYIEDSTIVLGTLDQGKSEYECTKFGQMEDYLKTQPRYSLKKIDGKWEEIPIES